MVSFTVGFNWRDREVRVSWDEAGLHGPDDVVDFLMAQQECGEPIAVVDGHVIEASFASRLEALDSLYSLVGPFSDASGDLGGEARVDLMTDQLPTDRPLRVVLIPVALTAVLLVMLILAIS